MIFGFTEAQISGFFLTYGVGAFIAYMLFIIGQLAWASKAGRFGNSNRPPPRSSGQVGSGRIPSLDPSFPAA